MKTGRTFLTLMTALATAFAPFFAIAAPTIGSVAVSGYLKRASGSVLSDGTYSATINIQSGGVTMTGCTFTGTIGVSTGYFTQAVPCTSANAAAGTSGGVTATAAITISGTAENFTINAYPVPTALVAGTALSVDAGVIQNSMIAGTAGISLSKLATSGATSGDVMTYNGTNWVNSTLGSLNIAATNAANTYTGNQTVTGNVTVSGVGTFATAAVTGDQTIGGHQTVTGAGTFGSLSVLAGVGITGGLAVGGSQTVGGYLSVAGVGTLSSAVITNQMTVGNGMSVAGTGTFGALSVTGATTMGTVSMSGDLSANAGVSLGSGTLSNNVNVTTGGTFGVVSNNMGTAAISLAVSNGTGGINITAGTSGIRMNGPLSFSTLTVASPGSSPYDGTSTAKALPSTVNVIFLTGTTATMVSCIQAGFPGQMLTVIGTGGIGTSLTFNHNVTTCTNGHKIFSPSTSTATGSTAVASVTAASIAVFQFISDGTAWYMVTKDL